MSYETTEEFIKRHFQGSFCQWAWLATLKDIHSLPQQRVSA